MVGGHRAVPGAAPDRRPRRVVGIDRTSVLDGGLDPTAHHRGGSLVSDRKLAWGIIGPGNIARRFASQLPLSATGHLVAVGSRQLEKAESFGKEYGAQRWYGDYESVLSDDGVDAVYIATPHPFHFEWAIKAAQAGKHILCEKPLTLNHATSMAGVEMARKHDVFLMEGGSCMSVDIRCRSPGSPPGRPRASRLPSRRTFRPWGGWGRPGPTNGRPQRCAS